MQLSAWTRLVFPAQIISLSIISAAIFLSADVNTCWAQAGNVVPATFAMPVYPNHGKVTFRRDGAIQIVEFSTPDSFQKVANFYQSQKNSGWKAEDQFNIGSENCSTSYKKGGETYNVRIVRYGNETKVVLHK
jgi:hypothetical protein